MRACILVAAALLLAATSSGCNGINLARRGGCSGCQQCGHGGGHMLGHGMHGGGMGHGGMGHGGMHGGMAGGMGGHHQSRTYTGPQGPTGGQVAYPYYTTRGPRDFLIDNPPSIGP